jgi:hypothetical protein
MAGTLGTGMVGAAQQRSNPRYMKVRGYAFGAIEDASFKLDSADPRGLRPIMADERERVRGDSVAQSPRRVRLIELSFRSRVRRSVGSVSADRTRRHPPSIVSAQGPTLLRIGYVLDGTE